MVSLFSVADGIFNSLNLFSLYYYLSQSRGPASEKSITRRADRLLNDLAVSLAEDHISLRRPETEEGTSNDTSSVAPKSVESARGRAVRSHGYSAPTKGSHSNKDLQSVGTDEGVAFSKETESGGHAVEEASQGQMTSLENSATQLAVSCFGDNSVQDSPNKLKEVYDITDLPAENSYDADACLNARNCSASPKVKLKPFNLSSEDHDFTTIEKNATFIVDDFEKTNKLELNETTASTKTRELASVGQLEQANSKTESFLAVDMEFSSDDTSPGVLQPNKTFCYAGNLNYTENETVNTKENENNVKKASHCVTADKIEIKTSEAGNIRMNNTRSHLLYTEQSIYGTEVSQRSSDTLKLGGCKMVERSYDSSLKRSLPPVKKERIDGICTEQELLNFKSSYAAVDPGNGKQEIGKTQNDQRRDEAYVGKHFGSSPRDIKDKEHAIVNVNSRMQIVNELDSALCDASYQEKKMHTGESHAEVTQVDFGHDNEDSHVYKARREKCNMKGAKMYTSNKAEVNGVESIDGTEQEGNKGGGICSVYEDKEEAHGTGQEVNDRSIVSVLNDIKKEIYDTAKGKNDNYLKNGGQSEESAEFDDNERRGKIYGEIIEDGLHNKEDSEDSQRKGNMESKSENGRIDAYDPEQDVYGRESNDVTSCVDNVFQERRIREGTDSDRSNKDQECDDEELVFNNTESECVTLKGLRSPSQKSRECNGYVTKQEMHSSQQLHPSGNTKKDSHATNNGALNMSRTEDKGLKKESCNLDGAYVNKEELSKTAVFSNVLNKQHERLKTKDLSLEINPQEKVDNSKTTDDGVTETRYCSFPSKVPCQSNTVVTHSQHIPGGANMSSTLSLNTCLRDQNVQHSHHLVPENFDNVDMEISSDEEHQRHGSSNSIVRVDDDGNARYNDASTPYSPSSPTRKSDEQCSPPLPPKDDSSPYSPSHPTNVSEGDMEHNDAVKELCYDDNEGERVADVCETRKEMINSDRLENSLETSKGAKNGNAPNIAALNHVINTDSIGVNTVSSPRDFSSPKPNSGSSQRVSLAKDFVDVNASAKDLAQYGRKNTSDEYDKYDGSNSTVCVDKFTGDDSNKATRKPVMRYPRRTQSVPTFTSGAPKPEVLYITATKKKHVRGESGSQSRPQILYITEEKAVPKSLSFDEPPRKQRPFVATPTSDCRSTERRTVIETERQKVEKRVRHVEPLLTECSYEIDGSSKPGNKDSRDDDNEEDTGRANTESRVNMALKTATTDIAVPTAEVGSGVFALGGVTDNSSSIDKQKAAFSNVNEQQGSLVKPSGAVLKDKAISFVSVAPLARDTLYKGSDVDNEAVNFLSNKHENESEDLRVFPKSLTMARDVTEIRYTNVDKDIDKAINNNNGKLYNGIPGSTIASTVDEDHISLGSARKNKTLVSQAPLKIRGKESQYCHTAATTYHAQGQTTELPSNCNFSAGGSVKDVNGDYSCGPVQMQMTSEMAGKRTSPALEITAFENGSSRAVLLENGACSESTVQEENVMNTKRDLDNQTLPNVSSRFANKRRHTDTSNEAPHPYKVPRKPLKLVMPNRDGKMAAKPGEKVARKTSSCTVTSADLDVAPGSNGLRVSEMINSSIIEDMLVNDFVNVNGNEKTTLLSSPTTKTNKASNRASTGTSELGCKTTSCTVTRVDVDFVPGSDGLAIDEENPGAIEERLKDNTSDSVDSELLTAFSPLSSNTKQAEGKGLCQDDNLSPVSGNMSPLSAHFAGYNQHDGPSLASFKDVNIEEQGAKGGKASFVGKEREWIAYKMERLRKKKEEIEQVTYFSNFL